MIKSALLIQARQNLECFEKQDWRVKFAIKKLKEIEKSAGIADVVDSPTLQNIVNILGPMAIYWKIDQVLKLLKEHGQEQKYSFKPL